MAKATKTKKKTAAKKSTSKKTTTKKPTAKKAVAKKAAAKKAPAKKASSKKITSTKASAKKVVKKAASKKTTTKTVSKKASAKTSAKVSAKKSAAKKPTKKASMNKAEKKVTKKASPAKKVAAKKSSPKKTSTTKPEAKKTVAKTTAKAGVKTRLTKAADGPLVTPYKERKGENYMNKEQIEHFVNILTEWKMELMNEVDQTVHHMKEESHNLPDPNDRASQEEEFSLELRTRDRERKLIRKIDKTLEAIKNDDYGYCEDCGIEIGIRRLEARPTATQCIDCKTLSELKEKQTTL